MRDQLQQVFSSKYTTESWKELLKNIFRSIDNSFFETPIDVKIEGIKKHEYVEHIWNFGDITIADNKRILFYEVELKGNQHVTKNRVGLRNIIHGDLIPGYIDGIMVTYYNPFDKDWRFSFISKSRYWNDDNQEIKEETAPKRFTYLLGQGETVRTPVEQFSKLIEKVESSQVSLADILEVFSVEKISKEFYNGYIKQYHLFEHELLKTPENYELFKKLIIRSQTPKEEREKTEFLIRSFVKKFLGRMVFIYFLQKKGWMGVPLNGDWGDGPRNFMTALFRGFADKNNYYQKVLAPLFFETLNTKREGDLFSVTQTKVPYLNGGLFDRNPEEEPLEVKLPEKLIKNLLDFFDQFNFTVDENQPNDQDVGVDPEMLSNIFENLLEHNKDMGAFYTPKEIVHYMTEESLLEYLKTACPNIEEQELYILVKNKEIGELAPEEQGDIDNALDKVKICDPAIGSGAFPMGLLLEIFTLKCLLAFEKGWTPGSSAKIKKGIIENSIYGVDIESGAVDIARLRFWLSLIVEEDTPHALPNLDYKIVCGDSLLSRYKLSDPIGKVLEQYNKGKGLDKKINVKGYKNLMHNYLNAEDKHQKDEYKNTIEDIKNAFKKEFSKKDKKEIYDVRDRLKALQVVDLFTKKTVGSKSEILKTQKKLEKLEKGRKDFEEGKIYKNAVEWRFQFPNLLNNKSGNYEGFDIVIGNPPYIQLQNDEGRLAKLYEKENFESFVKTGDIYCLFYEKGVHLLKEHGVLSYITSDKWMLANYGKKLRNFFLKNTNPRKLIGLGESVFKTATVNTNILISKKGDFETINVASVNSQSIPVIDSYIKNNLATTSFVIDEPWTILTAESILLKNEIERVGVRLKDFSWKINIYRGVLTGFNEAFIVSEVERKMLIDLETISNELIRPILLGRDLKRYFYNDNKNYLLGIHNGVKEKGIPKVDIDKYKAIKEFLRTFEERLYNRADQGDTPFHLRNCAYFEEFEKVKITWGNLARKAQFTLVPEGYVINAPSPFITPANKYLLAVLNSSVADFYIRTLGVKRNGGYFEYKPMFVEQLPVPQISEIDQFPYEVLVDFITYLKSNSTPIDQYVSNVHLAEVFEEVIDALVFELYFLKDFKKKEIEIAPHVDDLLASYPEGIPEESMREFIYALYQNLRDSKNPLRNQMKLMEIRLSHIINPIKAV